MRVIPAVDVKDGKCVRLLKGDFSRVTEYGDDPQAIARRFAALDVADLHIVDLDGARSGTPANAPLIAAIADELSLSIQVGGGIRNAKTLDAWLARGIDRCVIGSVAIENTDLVKSWFDSAGAERIVLALDVAIDESDTPMVATRGWVETSDTTLWECIEGYLDVGLRHVLCTDISRDGALAGPNLSLYKTMLARYPELQLQASGGVRNVEDLKALEAAQIPAAITGRALLDGRLSDQEVASFRRSA